MGGEHCLKLGGRTRYRNDDSVQPQLKSVRGGPHFVPRNVGSTVGFLVRLVVHQFLISSQLRQPSAESWGQLTRKTSQITNREDSTIDVPPTDRLKSETGRYHERDRVLEGGQSGGLVLPVGCRS